MRVRWRNRSSAGESRLEGNKLSRSQTLASPLSAISNTEDVAGICTVRITLNISDLAKKKNSSHQRNPQNVAFCDVKMTGEAPKA